MNPGPYKVHGAAADLGPYETYSARVLADSIAKGVRLTTIECTFPRFILAEFNTHRMLSRNSASSRAIPVEKRIAAVKRNPYIPEAFGANQRGMQARTMLDEDAQVEARATWLLGCAHAVTMAERLARIGAHKQWANRPLELYAWHTVIVTATEWQNFRNLRVHPDAQPEIQITARLMMEAMAASIPRELKSGEWHMPMIDLDVDLEALADNYDGGSTRELLVQASTGRCARVSFLTHDGKRDPYADIGLHDKLGDNGHMSPFEHCAQVFEYAEEPPFAPHYRFEEKPGGRHLLFGRRGEWVEDGYFAGNFRAPWCQYRKMIPGEAVFER